jgi:RHS repeat-associated protein
LIRINQAGNATLQASYTYDVGGRRVQSSISRNGQPASTVQYLYEGNQAIGEVRNGLLDVSLIGAVAVDDVVARVVSATSSNTSTAQVKTLLSDALGSVIAQTKADQSVENAYAYSPYGETQALGAEQGSANNLQYTGRENDGTGLIFNRARYWDPVLKRWISEDPIGLAGGPNVYAYVGGDPVSSVDPMGLATAKIGGDSIVVHKNDVDPWPSDPHGHIYDKNQVIDKEGKIYDKSTGVEQGQLPKKQLARYLEFLKKIGKLSIVGDLLQLKDLIDSVCHVASPGNPFCDPPPPNCPD